MKKIKDDYLSVVQEKCSELFNWLNHSEFCEKACIDEIVINHRGVQIKRYAGYIPSHYLDESEKYAEVEMLKDTLKDAINMIRDFFEET